MYNAVHDTHSGGTRTTWEGADNMEEDEQYDKDTGRYVDMGVGQCGRERLGKKGRRRGDRKNNERYEEKGRGDIRPEAGSMVHRIVH